MSIPYGKKGWRHCNHWVSESHGHGNTAGLLEIAVLLQRRDEKEFNGEGGGGYGGEGRR